MKIDGRQGTSQTGATDATGGTTPAATKTKSGGAGAPARTDRVEVSADGKLRADALKAANAAPDVRQDKVEAAKQKLAAGGLGQDADKLADSIIDDLLDK